MVTSMTARPKRLSTKKMFKDLKKKNREAVKKRKKIMKEEHKKLKKAMKSPDLLDQYILDLQKDSIQ